MNKLMSVALVWMFLVLPGAQGTVFAGSTEEAGTVAAEADTEAVQPEAAGESQQTDASGDTVKEKQKERSDCTGSDTKHSESQQG